MTLCSTSDSKEWATFFQSYGPYELFGSLTFPEMIDAISAHNATREFFTRFCRNDHGSHIRLALAWELQQRGVSHYHFMARSIGPQKSQANSIDPRALKDFWQGWTKGNAKIMAYNPTLGGEGYLAHHQHKGIVTLCPRTPSCRRDESCRYDASGCFWPGYDD